VILKSIVINGYKSFRKKIELPLSQRTSVLIGPNDHGKTNALLAVEKLNPEKPFLKDEVNDRLPGCPGP
jgi:predicted ATP-dependent endonuclease of OLD family